MDGISAAASILAVLQVTVQVIGYLKDVKDAPKECRVCQAEASNLHSLLNTLLFHINQGNNGEAWFASVEELTCRDGPLDQYREALDQLRSIVQPQDRISRVGRRLVWKFSKTEVDSILNRMHRVKSLMILALGTDHFKLSQAIKDDTTNIRSALPILTASTIEIRENQYEQQDQMLVEWLSPTDFPAQQHDIISERQDGTLQWFVESKEFKKWVNGEEKTLLCPGIPGAGKTMAAAVSIDYLYETTQLDNTIGIAGVFCSYKSKFDTSASALFAAILKQLLQSRPDLVALVRGLYGKYRGGKAPVEAILETLEEVCAAYKTVYIVIDALDEYNDRDGIHTQFVGKLQQLQTLADVRLLFTTRSLPNITEEFDLVLTLEIRAHTDDVRRYVRGQLPRLPKCIRRDLDLQSTIVSKISTAAEGMFLLAQLHVRSLYDKRNKSGVMNTLDKISRTPGLLDDAYSSAYNEAIQRIGNQPCDDVYLAKRALGWISHARRLLTSTELCYALAIEPGDSGLNIDNMYEIEDIISACAGLVTFDEGTGIIRLVHKTTQDYFERVRGDWLPDAAVEIATTCLTLLCFETFQHGSCASNQAFDKRVSENQFFDYVARFWVKHVQSVQLQLDPGLVTKTLCTPTVVDSLVQASHRFNGGLTMTFPRGQTGLHLTAQHGLASLARLLLETGNVEADAKDKEDATPLLIAAFYGQIEVVQLLLETGRVNANAKDEDGWTPLLRAAEKGYESVARLLLTVGGAHADLKSDRSGRTPLWKATEYAHDKVVKLLLETGVVDTNLKDYFGQSPLTWAAENGNSTIVQLLLATGKADVNLKDTRYGRTALSWAALNGHDAVAQLLIDAGKADPDLEDTVSGRTPLSWAAAKGHNTVVERLLNTGKVRANSKDSKFGRTPLIWASIQGARVAVGQLLSMEEIEVNAQGDNGLAPLSWAAICGDDVVAEKLLAVRKIDPDIRDDDGRTPLSWSAERAKMGVMERLLATGRVDPDSRDQQGRTPLSWAYTWAAAELLIATDQVDIDGEDLHGRTPLSWAASEGSAQVVMQLLATGQVNADSKDHQGRTPLSWAAEAGDYHVLGHLLDTGQVDANSKDNQGKTPLARAKGKNSTAIALLSKYIDHPKTAALGL